MLFIHWERAGGIDIRCLPPFPSFGVTLRDFFANVGGDFTVEMSAEGRLPFFFFGTQHGHSSFVIFLSVHDRGVEVLIESCRA